MLVIEQPSRSQASCKIHLYFTKTWKKVLSDSSAIINFILVSQSVLDFCSDHIRMALGWYYCF